MVEVVVDQSSVYHNDVKTARTFLCGGESRISHRPILSFTDMVHVGNQTGESCSDIYARDTNVQKF